VKIGQGEYEVGYGKPPRAHQWKPGQSGNPVGRSRNRPRSAPFDLAGALVEALLADQTVVIDGKKKKMPVFEIAGHGLARHLLTSGVREQLAIIRCLGGLGVLERLKDAREAMIEEEPPMFSEEDRRFFEMIKNALAACNDWEAPTEP
jgi:hypothetical protein